MPPNNFTSEAPPVNSTSITREGSSIILTMDFDNPMAAREYLGTLLMYLEEGSVSLKFVDGPYDRGKSMIPVAGRDA